MSMTQTGLPFPLAIPIGEALLSYERNRSVQALTSPPQLWRVRRLMLAPHAWLWSPGVCQLRLLQHRAKLDERRPRRGGLLPPPTGRHGSSSGSRRAPASSFWEAPRWAADGPLLLANFSLYWPTLLITGQHCRESGQTRRTLAHHRRWPI